MNQLNIAACIAGLLLVAGCASSNHGTFITSSYTASKASGEAIGKVTGESVQTWFLYCLPMGEGPSTDAAFADALSQEEDATFLTDMSIDDAVRWKIGYKEEVIRVQATARK